ncbi:MAG: hypothetical protein EOO38_28805 [Cytophagaceae bacterium]|nr:MAG: hypothetical protein EOO38_28805 [Cytophagaceae bacterium]
MAVPGAQAGGVHITNAFGIQGWLPTECAPAFGSSPAGHQSLLAQGGLAGQLPQLLLACGEDREAVGTDA